MQVDDFRKEVESLKKQLTKQETITEKLGKRMETLRGLEEKPNPQPNISFTELPFKNLNSRIFKNSPSKDVIEEAKMQAVKQRPTG